ncbi:hypothetical protein GCK72_025961 [Caenorhabditis remanei]|uniref:Uncharacterized protein n=1 Tax=Caenorhabditis remanei TaxID=31234 RepID=A0A6A5G3V4_CAERE|nr:hypothetical protein GCK72_025961 [Caenorhabditis remanei]KAF1749493.1 hypothetical protein GCK72_025961 [Caenorhabditis remanei]
MSNAVPSLGSIAQINMEKAFRACFDKLTGETNDSGSLLKLRLVNKLFNTESLRKLRILHKEIIVEVNHHAFADDDMNLRYNMSNHILVNDADLIISEDEEKDEFRKYLNFLNETVQVKVYKLMLKNVYKLGATLKQVAHDAIVNVLVGPNNRGHLVEVTGMEDVCMSGCEDCTSLIKKCNVCGPIQWHALARLKQNEKFDTIIISDNLLTLIAEDALMRTPQNEDMLPHIDKIIPPLQCTNLVFVVTDDSPDLNVRNQFGNAVTTIAHGISLVILNEVLKKWKPNKITLEAHVSRPTRWFPSYKYQERFKHTLFTSSSDSIQENQHQMFEHLTVDLTFAGKFIEDFDRHNHGRNLIPNVLKMFPTKEMAIIFPRGFGYLQNMTSPNFYLCKAILSHKPTDMKVWVQMYPDCPEPKKQVMFSAAIKIDDERFGEVQQPENNPAPVFVRKCFGLNKKNRKIFKLIPCRSSTYVIEDKTCNNTIMVQLTVVEHFFNLFVHAIPRGTRPFTIDIIQSFITPDHSENCDFCNQFMAIYKMHLETRYLPQRQ